MEQRQNDGSLSFLGIEPDEFVKTRFEVGWAPEIIREIKQTSINATLIWGY